MHLKVWTPVAGRSFPCACGRAKCDASLAVQGNGAIIVEDKDSRITFQPPQGVAFCQEIAQTEANAVGDAVRLLRSDAAAMAHPAVEAAVTLLERERRPGVDNSRWESALLRACLEAWRTLNSANGDGNGTDAAAEAEQRLRHAIGFASGLPAAKAHLYADALDALPSSAEGALREALVVAERAANYAGAKMLAHGMDQVIAKLRAVLGQIDAARNGQAL